MTYSNTRRHFLKHMGKLVGGVVTNTPSGGRELEHFITYEAHRAHFIVNICRFNRFYRGCGELSPSLQGPLGMSLYARAVP